MLESGELFIDNVNTVAVGKLKNENYQHLQNSYFDYCENLSEKF